MEIVVTGRNVEVPEHFRVHVAEKVARLERYDHRMVGMEVELFHERNRRQMKSCQRVEITGMGRGPAVRAEATAGDFYAALDAAVTKLENRLRRLHDRRRVHYGRRSPSSVAEATAAQTMPTTNGRASTAVLPARTEELTETETEAPAVPVQRWDTEDENLPGRVVREKQHSAEPMTVDEALYQMELVGHDFYLFKDSSCGQPSVVYRRRAFDYGVIRLV